MPRRRTIITRAEVTGDGIAPWIAPRHDLVIEEPGESDGATTTFRAASGPFTEWHREVTVGSGELTERIDYRLAVPVWGALFALPVGRHLRRPPSATRATPWWAPPDVLSARAATVLSLLCVFGLVGGYLGTLITQTLTYAAADFGASTADQGTRLAGVRIGVLLSLGIIATADRRGRRAVLAASLLAACAITALSALAPGMVWLGASQTFARAFSTVVALVIAIIAVEEMPAGARAFALSVLTMAAALGAGLCVLNLVYIDRAIWAWRIAFVIPLLFLLPCWRLMRDLPETFRFVAHREATRDAGDDLDPEAPPLRSRIDRRRFLLLACGAFLWSLFLAPAAQFLNEFLRTERGFSGVGIAVFVLATNTPGGLGIVLGGRLADRHGRRVIGAIGIAGGVGFTVVAYLTWGWSLWLASIVASVIGAIAVPALAVYGPELFPTEQRGRANGGLQVVAVAGSSAGLLTAGWLADRVGGLGHAMALLSIGPVLLIVLVLTRFPETARRELEDINPTAPGHR